MKNGMVMSFRLSVSLCVASSKLVCMKFGSIFDLGDCAESCIGFEVFTAVTMKNAVLWDVAPEDGGDTFLRNPSLY
jgi:hypothetical protein